ncbi:MAG: sulfotransferase family protein [Actinomycetia bacterium]|nr:sulfotransferase family protein [Actinomycetes bacterium]
MPVYRKHQLLHIHIPKTGGTSIEEYFHSVDDMVWGLPSWVGQEERQGRWFEFQHLSLPELREFTGNEFDQYESFAVVRDPYARLVSEFRWRQAISTDHPHSTTRGFESIAAFLSAIPRDIDTHWEDHIGSADQSEANFLIHVRPQHHYIFDAGGTLLVDHVLRFERLRQELTPLLQSRGLSADTFNSTPSWALEEYFDQGQLDLVSEIYARDLARLPYSHR